MELQKDLPQVLLDWYDAGHRELPWRQTREPYPIWLSEIMLQQTRVEAVKGYYTRFLQACPTIAHLAACDDEALLKLWEGLGYYSRARNLKKAAQIIQARHGGIFPRAHADVLALPGIGEYTAGAICSIAFDQPTPAVDGNVLRLFARLRDDSSPIDLPETKKRVTRELAAMYPSRAGDFTQALMELGATVCGPNRVPDCEHCPCRELCLGYRKGTAQELPRKLPKKEKRTEERTVFVLCCDGRYALEKRPKQGLLAGLWQFPNVPGKLDTTAALDALASWGLHPREILREVNRTHIFTHIRWEMKGIYLEVARENEAFTWLSAEELEKNAALPTAFRMFWEEIHHV